LEQYGLIGYPLGHSFSQRFFSEKFAREGLANVWYDLFPLPDIAELPALLTANPNLRGLNVTIPYKETVLRYLHDLDETARAVGAVNTIRIRNGRLRGFNTDVTGFEQSLQQWHTELGHTIPLGMHALILGTGGAAKAVAYALQKMGIEYTFVSRSRTGRQYLSYTDLHTLSAGDFTLIVNATPAGTFPDVDACPPIPFDVLDERHLVFDLVYNPAETLLLQRAKTKGAAVKNGLEMLQLQAEAAWKIWQE